MSDPYNYFQAGVLVLNTCEMRRLHTIEEWLEIASNPNYIYNDQDILNAQCEGRVHYLDPAWNVMHDCGGGCRRFSRWRLLTRIELTCLPAPLRASYTMRVSRSRGTPLDAIGASDIGVTLARRLFTSRCFRTSRCTPVRGEGLRCVPFPRGAARRIVDPVLPVGSRRREAVKSIARKVRGL